MEQEIGRWIGAASAVMQTLYRSVVVKRELSQKVKLLIYWSVYCYPHLLPRAANNDRKNKMSFVRRVSALNPRAADPLHRKEPAKVIWASD